MPRTSAKKTSSAGRRGWHAAIPVIGILLSGCVTPSAGNAPPAVVDECRQEIADLTALAEQPTEDPTLPEEPGPEATAIDDARAAKEETGGGGLANWPEDALLYRCLAGRGVVLTEEQANLLAEWQGREDSASGHDSD